jgi:hypothetical protein
MKTKKKFGIAVAAFLFGGVISCNPSPQQQPTAQQPPVQAEKQPESVVAFTRPTIPPPKFRFYRSKFNEGVSVVVSPVTTDEQLKSLLWLFREKVRSHRFKDIGITQPISMNFWKEGYLSGIISVYRGDKCAGENFLDVVGPCGQGEHDAAFYQWGFKVDGVFQTDADDGIINSSDGNDTRVFNYTDQWQLPAKLQTGSDGTRER